MQTLHLIKRAENLGLSNSWIVATVIREGTGYKFRPFSWFKTSSRRGRRWECSDDTKAICKELDLIGIQYKLGNDAPRGGRAGDFIEIQTKIGRIQEKGLMKIPMMTIRLEDEVYGKILSKGDFLYKEAMKLSFHFEDRRPFCLSKEWFMLNKKILQHVKVVDIQGADVRYFKEIRTKTIALKPFDVNTYFVVKEQDKIFAIKTIGELLKNYGYSFDLEKDIWSTKGNEPTCLFKSNIHPSIYQVLVK